MFKLPSKLKNKKQFTYLDSFDDTIQINPNGTKLIYYLHGGAFAFEMDLYYYDFFERLAKATDAHIIIPIYPKTPKVTYKKIHEIIINRYEYVATLFKHKEIIVMGDSAGGNLCFILGLNTSLKPNKIITISPWLDISTTNLKMKEIEPFDPFLTIEMLQKYGKIYAPNIDLKSPIISPLYNDLSVLPPSYIFMGTHDILYADYLLIQNRYSNIKCYTFENHIHCFALLEQNKDGFNKILEII